MIYDIRHRTTYHYSQPVRESMMEVRKRPRALPHQRILSFDIETYPQARVFQHEDWLGNHVHHFDVPQPHDELTILSRARVELSDPLAPLDTRGLDVMARLRSHELRTMCWDYLAPSHFVEDTPLLRAFIQRHDLAIGRDLADSLARLNSGLFEAIAYTPGVTNAHSRIDEALEMAKGVCQDYAHIFLSIARAHGVPARYVSGYLAPDKKKPDRSLPDASHAWVECLYPDHGWVGYDPTNNMMASRRHVVLAYGRDYADVTPARGVLKGGATTTLEVAVEVSESRNAPHVDDGSRFFKIPKEKPAPLAKTARLGPVAPAIQAMQAQQ